jgi:hypothetical protein
MTGSVAIGGKRRSSIKRAKSGTRKTRRSRSTSGRGKTPVHGMGATGGKRRKSRSRSVGKSGRALRLSAKKSK